MIFLKIFFLMWIIFKVFTEFATILFLFYVLCNFFFFWLQGMWDLSSPTRDRMQSPPALESEVLAHGLPGKSHYYHAVLTSQAVWGHAPWPPSTNQICRWKDGSKGKVPQNPAWVSLSGLGTCKGAGEKWLGTNLHVTSACRFTLICFHFDFIL